MPEASYYTEHSWQRIRLMKKGAATASTPRKWWFSKGSSIASWRVLCKRQIMRITKKALAQAVAIGQTIQMIMKQKSGKIIVFAHRVALPAVVFHFCNHLAKLAPNALFRVMLIAINVVAKTQGILKPAVIFVEPLPQSPQLHQVLRVSPRALAPILCRRAYSQILALVLGAGPFLGKQFNDLDLVGCDGNSNVAVRLFPELPAASDDDHILHALRNRLDALEVLELLPPSPSHRRTFCLASSNGGPLRRLIVTSARLLVLVLISVPGGLDEIVTLLLVPRDVLDHPKLVAHALVDCPGVLIDLLGLVRLDILDLLAPPAGLRLLLLGPSGILAGHPAAPGYVGSRVQDSRGLLGGTSELLEESFLHIVNELCNHLLEHADDCSAALDLVLLHGALAGRDQLAQVLLVVIRGPLLTIVADVLERLDECQLHVQPVGVLQVFDPLLQLEKRVFVVYLDGLLVGGEQDELLQELEAEADAVVGDSIQPLKNARFAFSLFVLVAPGVSSSCLLVPGQNCFL